MQALAGHTELASQQGLVAPMGEVGGRDFGELVPDRRIRAGPQGGADPQPGPPMVTLAQSFHRLAPGDFEHSDQF